MVGGKVYEIPRCERYARYVAATKDSCNEADGRFPKASRALP